MSTTAVFKRVSSLVALALAGVMSGSFSIAGTPAPATFHATVVYQDASAPPDCDKTPDDPRCKEKK